MTHLLSSFIDLLTTFWLALQAGQMPALGFWIYPLLTIFVAVEGPFAILLGAAAASAGLMDPLLVFAAACTGNLIADSLWYSLGYFGKVDWLIRRSQRFGVNPAQIERFTGSIRLHAVKLLFFAKLTNGFVVPALVAAGLVRVPWRRWFPLIALGETLVTGVLVAVIYFTAASLSQVEKGFQYFIFAFSLLFLLAAFIIARRIFRQNAFEKM
jgi:membrane protein DedA with SNARE-associated domain